MVCFHFIYWSIIKIAPNTDPQVWILYFLMVPKSAIVHHLLNQRNDITHTINFFSFCFYIHWSDLTLRHIHTFRTLLHSLIIHLVLWYSDGYHRVPWLFNHALFELNLTTYISHEYNLILFQELIFGSLNWVHLNLVLLSPLQASLLFLYYCYQFGVLINQSCQKLSF